MPAYVRLITGATLTCLEVPVAEGHLWLSILMSLDARK